MKYFIVPAIMTLVSGCSLLADEEAQVAEISTASAIDDVYRYPNADNTTPSKEDPFLADPLPRNINFYIRGMMQDLVTNLQYVNRNTPVAVTSFIYLDGKSDQSSLLGNQIAESLYHEIHKVGIPILDHKVTDYLRVTEQGDFIISRDFNEIPTSLPINYVVTGNLVKHRGGYLVNSRIVGIISKEVVATAQSFIPAEIANALLNSATEQESSQVSLIQ